MQSKKRHRNALEDDKLVQYDPKSISKVFKTSFEILLEQLLRAPNKYDINLVKKCHKDLDITNKFRLKPSFILKLLKKH